MTFHYYHLVSYNLNLFCLPFISIYLFLIISHRISSRLIISLRITSHHVSHHVLSHLKASYRIISHYVSPFLIMSHLNVSPSSHPLNRIPSRHIISYHFSPSHTSSAIIFHISRHPASSTQWKPAALLHSFCPPPGLKSSCRHFSTFLPLFLFLNFKTRSTRCDAKSMALYLT